MIEVDTLAMTDRGFVGALCRLACEKLSPRFDATEILPLADDLGDISDIDNVISREAAIGQLLAYDWGRSAVVRFTSKIPSVRFSSQLGFIDWGERRERVITATMAWVFSLDGIDWFVSNYVTSIYSVGEDGSLSYRDGVACNRSQRVLSLVYLRTMPLAALFALSACKAKVVSAVPRRDKKKRRRQAERRHGVKGRTFYVLTIDPNADAREQDYHGPKMPSAARRFHFVRAHIRTRACGRLEWVSSHYRGNRKVGEVQKDYRIAPAR